KEQVLKGLNDAKDTTVLIWNEAGEAVQKTENWIDDKGFKTNEEVKKDEEIKAQKEAEEKAQKVLDEILAKATERTKKILSGTGWNGEALENINNSNVINQMSKTELVAVGLPTARSACVFFSTAYGAADALGITLSPEDVKKVYDYAINRNPPSIGTNAKGEPSAYWVRSFSGIVDAVAAVKKVDASNISIPKKLITTTSESGAKATKDIVNALQSGGSAQVRYSGHSMRVTGSFIENGNVILNIKDTAFPNRKTYVDTSTMSLYTLNKKKERVPSDRVLTHYLPINKNNNVAVNKN
nr:hypothetical protein [Spirochaetota bacterium]